MPWAQPAAWRHEHAEQGGRCVRPGTQCPQHVKRRPNYESFEFKIAEPMALESISADEMSCNTCGNDLDTAAILNGYGAHAATAAVSNGYGADSAAAVPNRCAFLCKQGGRSWPIHGNGDDALPIDPALAARRAAMAASTNTFGSPAPRDDITNQQKSTSGTGSRSVNPFGRPCLFAFRLCRQHFSTHRRT
ncbi:hypothetical protein KC345_g1223 [Hortaea werneckii]|nr:hypothetical protein KC345_g1223 [Hortaea werneckii]